MIQQNKLERLLLPSIFLSEENNNKIRQKMNKGKLMILPTVAVKNNLAYFGEKRFMVMALQT